ncbi:MAG: flagellar basal body rod protein FlgB [Rhodocyclaceae bacterium]|nr:flagellar basal body rod protein FlgB [Rhodocyclaceae bacterium]
MVDIAQHFSVLSKALDLRTQRHQVLASNIANADTPNYKARDFDFRSAMAHAIGADASNGGGMVMTARGHQSGSGALSGPGALQFRTESQSAVDGNTVEMDVERSEITDNALQYQILTQLISNKFQGLRTAMSSTNS